jgi:hypothetical protein
MWEIRVYLVGGGGRVRWGEEGGGEGGNEMGMRWEKEVRGKWGKMGGGEVRWGAVR